MQNTAYKEFYDRILKTLAETIEKKFPECLGQSTSGWGEENRRALYDEIKGIEAEIDSLWLEKADFKVFKDKVLAWGKDMLALFGEHSKWLRENPAPKATPHPDPLPMRGEGINNVGAHCDAPREAVQVGMF